MTSIANTYLSQFWRLGKSKVKNRADPVSGEDTSWFIVSYVLTEQRAKSKQTLYRLSLEGDQRHHYSITLMASGPTLT